MFCHRRGRSLRGPLLDAPRRWRRGARSPTCTSQPTPAAPCLGWTSQRQGPTPPGQRASCPPLRLSCPSPSSCWTSARPPGPRAGGPSSRRCCCAPGLAAGTAHSTSSLSWPVAPACSVRWSGGSGWACAAWGTAPPGCASPCSCCRRRCRCLRGQAARLWRGALASAQLPLPQRSCQASISPPPRPHSWWDVPRDRRVGWGELVLRQGGALKWAQAAKLLVSPLNSCN
jgi:hypothetical protein